jgi:hypothetical protein
MTPKSRPQRRQYEGERRQQRAGSYNQAGAERDRAENVALQLVVIRAFRVTSSLNLGRHVQRFDHEASFTPSGLRRQGSWVVSPCAGRPTRCGRISPAALPGGDKGAKPPAETRAVRDQLNAVICELDRAALSKTAGLPNISNIVALPSQFRRSKL